MQFYSELSWVKSINSLILKLFLSFISLSSREAESFKEQGNAYYIKKDYSEAFNYYTKAIGKNSISDINCKGYPLYRVGKPLFSVGERIISSC